MSLLGSLIETGYQAINNERDRDYQKALQEEIFAREDTAVQRRMADLKAAGLNPNLAAGSAAGVGSVVGRSNTPGIGLGSVLDDIQAKNQIKLQEIETENAKEQNEILHSEANIKGAQAALEKAALFSNLGIPVDIEVIHDGQGNFNFRFNRWNNNQKELTSTPLFENVLNQKNYLAQQLAYLQNSNSLLSKENSWYNANQLINAFSSGAGAISGAVNSGANYYKAHNNYRR